MGRRATRPYTTTFIVGGQAFVDPCDAQAIWLRRLLPELKKLGIQPRVLFFAVARPEQCQSLQLFREQGIPCSVTRNRGTTGNFLRWYLRELQRDPPDVFVPQHITWALYAARWAREAGIPTVCVLHSVDQPCRGLLAQFGGQVNPFRVSAFVAVSSAIRELALATTGMGTRVEVIPCGVPVPLTPVEYKGGPLRICYLGRLTHEAKRIVDVARAFCRAVREVPEVEAFIWGAGAEEGAMREVLAKEGKGLPVTFGGSLRNDEALAAMRACHAVVLLSDYEGTPTVLMEGMASGLVPIATRIGDGTEELVQHNVTGLLLENREEAFVEAVKQLRVPEVWQRLSRNARALVRSGYSGEVCAGKWARVLTSLKQENPRPRRIVIPRVFSLPPPVPSLSSSRRVPWLLDAPVGWAVAAKRWPQR